MEKIKLVIADDEAECRREFTCCSDMYDVREVENSNNLVAELEKLYAEGFKPDIVLLDIWCPPNNTPPDQEQREQRARKSLHDLTAQLEKTRKAVQEAWIPRGFDILRELRSKWSDSNELPVAMYSKRGHFLATSKNLEDVEKLEAHWILKHDENEYFEYVQDCIKRIVTAHEHSTKMQRQISRTLNIAVVAIFASIVCLGLLVAPNNSAPMLRFIGVSIFSVLLTFGINKLLHWRLNI